MEMFETTITLRPTSEWRPGMTQDRLIAEMDSAVRMPGIRNAWTMPIRGRIDMLATGIRTPVGIKVFGPDLATLEQLARQIEMAVQGVPGTRSAYAERAEAGYYLDIDIDRAAAARHGLNVGDVQTVIAAAIGGMTITQTVEGRERFGVRVRYPQEMRDTPERLGRVLVPAIHASAPASASAAADPMSAMSAPGTSRAIAYVPLGQVATIRRTVGPMVVRTEGAQPTAWVYVDVAGRDIGRYVRDARQVVERDVKLPTGYSLQWSGQFDCPDLPAAVPELRALRRNGHRPALASVRARRRIVVHRGTWLQLVGGGCHRLHRARGSGRRNRRGDAALPQPGLGCPPCDGHHAHRK
jgi:Cu(I)/Ag(I) efflux system membrane protein CusA/SilA